MTSQPRHAEPPGAGALMRKARERAGMTQASLAARLGITAPAVGLRESGQRDMSLGNFLATADALGVHPVELLPPPAGVLPGTWDITVALMAALPMSRALAEALAEVVSQVLAAEHEARLAWEQAGMQADAKARLMEAAG